MGRAPHGRRVVAAVAAGAVTTAAAGLAGCAPSERACAPVPEVARPAAAGGPAEAPAAPAAVTLAVEAAPAGRAAVAFHVVLRAGSPAELRALALEGDASAVKVVSARDGGGVLAVSVEADVPGRSVLRAARDPAPPYEVVYEVAAPPPPTTPAPALAADENLARVPGAWFALPRALDDRVLDVELALGKVGGQPAKGASSLAPGPTFRGPLRVGALRGSYALLGGDVGTARFDAYEGVDHAAWMGFTSFDPRWVAAESAGVRTALDRWMGAKAGPPHALVIVAERRRGAPMQMADLAGGLFVTADLNAPWDAAARLRVAQHFAQRFFGGALAVGERSGPRAAVGDFWSEGAARVVGREVAFELGLVSFDELAGDLNVALGELTLSPLRGEGLDALVQKAAGGAEARDARRTLAARGIVWLSGLDARARAASKGARSAREVVRALFAAAAKAGQSTWSLDELQQALVTAAGEEERAHFRAVVVDGAAPERGLPDGAAGSCHRLERKPVARFELGFAWEARPATEGGGPEATDLGVVREVQAGSAAERAGLRPGEPLVSATFSEGRPDVKAEVVVRRAGAEKKLGFFPRGPEREGPIFVRRKGARDESCTR